MVFRFRDHFGADAVSDFEYLGVVNNQMQFREESSGMTHWLQTTPRSEVELLEGDLVRFESFGSYRVQTWSIRQTRPID